MVFINVLLYDTIQKLELKICIITKMQQFNF